MNRPTAPEWSDEKYPDDTSAWAYEDERDEFILQANAYMDHLEAELAEADAEANYLREQIFRINKINLTDVLSEQVDVLATEIKRATEGKSFDTPLRNKEAK